MTQPPYPDPNSTGSGFNQGQDSGYWQNNPYGQGGYGQSVPAYSAAGQVGGQCPPSNVGWAVASILFFWPLSFIAMTRALEVYPLWAAGRHAEAQAASATAKKFGIISIALVAVLFVLYFLFIFVMVGVAASGY